MSYQHLSRPELRLFPRQYYNNNPEIFEEPESFVDRVSLSESDGYIDILPKVRSVPSHDIQELYIRKPLISSSQISPFAPQSSRCWFNSYWTGHTEPVYEHPQIQYAMATGQAIPRRSSSAYVTRRNTSSVPNNLTATQTGIHQDNFSTDTMFKSAPTIPTDVCQKTSGDTQGFPRNKIPGAMTYRASRCARKNTDPSTVLKKQNNSFGVPPRQSAAHSPKRPMKSQIPLVVSKSQEIRLPPQTQPDSMKCRTLPEMRNINQKIDVRKMNSEGDATGYKPNINSLDTIERIVASLDENDVEELSEDHKKEIRRISKYLQPRVPSSVKSLFNKPKVYQPNGQKTMMNDGSVTNPTEKQSDFLKKSLHDILDQLENCELSLNAVRAKYSADRQKALNTGNKATEDQSKADDVFNLREITAKISSIPNDKKIIEQIEEEKNQSIENVMQAEEIYDSERSHSIEQITSDGMNTLESKNSLDDNGALELHRSKSYIVNLIDRALSKELGVIPKESIEKYRNEFQDLNTVRAINHIKKNCRLNNNCHETMDEVTDQEINLIISPTDSNQHQSALSKDIQPAYIKQLKELRWGHFKHIQQEVRRLEDLERFLDTCGIPCDDTYEDIVDNNEI